MTARKRIAGEAYVLHSRPYRDASALVELFTLRDGRVTLVVGGLGSTSLRSAARRAALQPAQPLLIRAELRGELGRLLDLEVAGSPLRLPGAAALAMFYLNELLLRLLPRQEIAESLFCLYAETLGRWEQDADLAASLRQFECALLAQIGYAVDFRVDVGGQPITPQQFYRWRHGDGAERCAASANDAFSGEVLLALQQQHPLHGAQAAAARRLLRACITPHLAGKPLRSWGLLGEMQQLERASAARNGPPAGGRGTISDQAGQAVEKQVAGATKDGRADQASA